MIGHLKFEIFPRKHIGTCTFRILYTSLSLNSLSLPFASIAALNVNVTAAVRTGARNWGSQPFLLQDGNGVPSKICVVPQEHGYLSAYSGIALLITLSYFCCSGPCHHVAALCRYILSLHLDFQSIRSEESSDARHLRFRCRQTHN